MSMETKINIAAILKDKPQGTKLYDLLYNIDVKLDTISTTDIETVVWCTNETDNNTTCHRDYSEFGTIRKCNNGLQILLPSKEMRDWNKFSWKKGDVLVNSNRDVHIIFEGFENDTYTRFKGKHYLWKEGDQEDYNKEENKMLTSVFVKVNDDAVKCYINAIEKRLGGKLNRETLEIEPAQPEFKDGDIVSLEIHYIDSEDVIVETYIVHGAYSYGKMNFYAGWSDNTIDKVVYNSFISPENSSIRKEQLRYATKEEKQQFFKALAKEGKAWDAEKKMIVELKPKVELKPFDKVLVRDTKYSEWQADFFSNIDEDNRFVCVGATWSFCIPYNEETAKLIGTTNNVEG